MQNLKFAFFVLILFSISFSNILAQTSPFQFLRYNASARAAALGGTFNVVENDASAVFFNPATLYTLETDKNFSTTFLKHILDINSGNAVYATDKIFSEGVVAFSVSFTDYGNFDEATRTGELTGRTFGGNDVMMGMSYSNELDSNFYYGVTAKLLYVTLENQSTAAIALDGGLFYKLRDGRSNLALSFTNLGTQITTVGDISESLPLDIRIGANHRLKGLPLLVNFNFTRLADEGSIGSKFKNFAVGAELYLGSSVQVRAGYDNNIRNLSADDTNKGMAGMNFGVGILLENLNFDYAMSGFGAGATMHRLSLALEL